MKEREMGIDLLRIIAMFMVVLLHTLDLGFHYTNMEVLSSKGILSWVIVGGCYCAVNVYALISGYVMFDQKCSLKRLVSLYLEVLFYSLISTILILILNPEAMGVKGILKSVLPFLSGQFWYFTAYFVMYLFIPIFNMIIKSLSFENVRSLIFKLLIVLGVFPWIGG